MQPQPVNVHVIIRFSRRSIAAEKIALASLKAMEPSEYSRRAIAELTEEIAAKEKILDEREALQKGGDNHGNTSKKKTDGDVAK
jgi:hypothetical protein